MRQKRAKAYKKQMATYERNFGFRHPYQVLYMADFLEAAHGFHLDSVAGVKRTLQNESKSMITQCCIKELYDAKADPSIRLAKTMERRRCGHVEKPETPHDCVLECVGTRNKNRYVVATQDVALREKLRRVPGVPLIYINRSVMILEPASPATTMIKEEREKAKVGLSPEEAVILGKRKRADVKPSAVSTDRGEALLENEDPAVKKSKRRGPPGPNPLSIRKPKSILKKPNVTITEGHQAVQEPESTDNKHDDAERTRVKRKRKHKKDTSSNQTRPTEDGH